MIGEREALDIARAAAQAEGWSFVEPAEAALRKNREGRPCWQIRSNAGRLGASARFTIDAADGGILEKGYIPR